MTIPGLQYAQDHRQASREALIEFLRFPSISTLPDHQQDMQNAVGWLMNHTQNAGLENVQIIETEGHPAVYADWLHAPDQPVVLVYGHYDVQPVDPVHEWHTPPFEPTLQGDDLIARGASDDKGQVMIHIEAVKALLQAEGQLPVNVKFLIEGEEEIGSPNLTPAMKQHADLLAADICVISDSNILAPDKPSLVYGLRGLVYAEIEMHGPSLDLHSGRYGGGVHNPLQAMCELIAQLHDNQGKVTVPGFNDAIRELNDLEKAEMAALEDDALFLQETGAPKTWGEVGYSTLERVGARGTLEVHGIRGGFTGEGGKTVIPATAVAKISMRLAANQPSEDIAQSFQRHVLALAPDTVKTEVRIMQTCDPVITDREHPAVQAATKAYQESFGNPPVFMLDGGSIPVVDTFQNFFGLPVVLMGFGLPDDRLHSPNEKFHLPNFHNGIECVIRFLHHNAIL